MSVPARADDACPKGTLGISRIWELDTTGRPWFGAPHGDPNLLSPGEVVLTFDDGPSPADTREILSALAKECTKATFFMVGEMVARHPEIVKEVADQGHTIGTRSWSHPNLARLSQAELKQEIEATFGAVQKASSVPVAPFYFDGKRRDCARFPNQFWPDFPTGPTGTIYWSFPPQTPTQR